MVQFGDHFWSGDHLRACTIILVNNTIEPFTRRGPKNGLAGCGISIFSLPGCGMKENLKAGCKMPG